MSNVIDPRHKNKKFNTSSIGNYLSDYAAALRDTLNGVDPLQMAAACEAILKATEMSGHIYVAGNGGSAAIADHLCCDLTKGTATLKHKTIATHSLSSNVALYSAIANDFGFEKVFSTQVGFFGKEGDVLIAISSSGNSQNIVNAAEQAKALGLIVIGLTGFEGGKLRQISDIPLHADVQNYGVVEDCHQALMHILAQYIASGRDG
ncbi:SIS domain-containing protein [Ensifer sp. ENS06]|uniref:SIS domain-containing protein n=1 Tax=Ensifer sp. ENS06 TaxID=2769276 RepID=UPI001784A4D3|nr:SIS domain-containing protein [Ensifer sp. ENS06]MBD9625268.1 SIS domain-containing protein [Ensifer sp. ENS06]